MTATNSADITAAIKLTEDAVTHLREDIQTLEAALSVHILEDAFLLIMEDPKELSGGRRVFGHWAVHGSTTTQNGFKHTTLVPAHICGTVHFSQVRAQDYVRKCNARSKGEKYSCEHVRQFRTALLADRKASLVLMENLLAGYRKQA